MEKNEKIQDDGAIKNKRKDFFVIFLATIIAVSILFILVNFLMTNSKVNQGKFRVSDVLVTSDAILEDTSPITSRWTFNVSQRNKISLLIIPSDNKFSACIKDLACTKKGLIIYQTGYEEQKINIDNSNNLKLVSNINEDGTILYEIEFLNKDVLTNFEIPSNITEIKHDATVLNLAKFSTKELEYTVVFKLEMIDSNGKSSVMNVTLKLPEGNIIKDGNVVKRLDVSNFVFKVK